MRKLPSGRESKLIFSYTVHSQRPEQMGIMRPSAHSDGSPKTQHFTPSSGVLFLIPTVIPNDITICILPDVLNYVHDRCTAKVFKQLFSFVFEAKKKML